MSTAISRNLTEMPPHAGRVSLPTAAGDIQRGQNLLPSTRKNTQWRSVVSEIRAIQSIRAMSFFVQVLNALRIMLAAHFWLIWTTITTAAAICVALAVGHVATRITREENKGAISLGLTWRQVGGPRAFAAMALVLAVFLGA